MISSPGFAGSAPPLSAHSNTAGALELVQHAPPFMPTNALIAAVEFTYVTGTMRASEPIARSSSCIASHASTASS